MKKDIRMDYCYRCCAYHCRFSTEIPVYFLYRLRGVYASYF